MHAVIAEATETLAQIGTRAALCGLRPGTGWGLDLYIERKCTRCERKANRSVIQEVRHEPGWRGVTQC